MEICSRSEIMSWALPMDPKHLWRLVFRALPKVLSLSHSLLKKFLKAKNLHEPKMKSCTVVGDLPELPQDILISIFSTLDTPDLLRAGLVCSSWRSAYISLASLGLYSKHQTPCLLYSSVSAGDNVACLYSLVEQRVYRLALPKPPIRRREIIGSSNGWLATVSEACEVHLINPITRQQINLPSVTTIEHVRSICNDSGSSGMYEYSWHMGTEEPFVNTLILNASELRERLVYKAFIFSDTSKGRYFIVLIHNPWSQLSFAWVGDDKWTWLPPYTHYLDCFYKDSLLYAITSWGKIHVFDLCDSIITTKVIMSVNSTMGNSYIIQDPLGDLLHIRRLETVKDNYNPNADPITYVRHTGKIELYKIDIAAEAVVESNSLHDHILFLGHNQTLCLHAEKYPTLKANHAYFTDDDELFLKGYRNNRRDIGVFNVDCNCREELVSPQLWSNWPAPIWVVPSLTKM